MPKVWGVASQQALHMKCSSDTRMGGRRMCIAVFDRVVKRCNAAARPPAGWAPFAAVARVCLVSGVAPPQLCCRGPLLETAQVAECAGRDAAAGAVRARRLLQQPRDISTVSQTAGI